MNEKIDYIDKNTLIIVITFIFVRLKVDQLIDYNDKLLNFHQLQQLK